jgi:Sap, sulfolipid-1-addressing protein
VLWEAFPVALAAAFSPWTLLIVAHLLGEPRPVRRALAFLGTAAAITLAVGYAVVLLLNQNGLDDPRHHRTVPAGIDLGIGLVILVLGALLAFRPPRERKVRRRREMGLLGAVLLGGIAGSPSGLYLASLHSVAKGHPGSVGVALQVFLIAVIVLLMAEIPIVLYIVAPERTAARLETANRWLGAHGRAIAVGVAAVVGTYFVVNGLYHLV